MVYYSWKNIYIIFYTNEILIHKISDLNYNRMNFAIRYWTYASPFTLVLYWSFQFCFILNYILRIHKNAVFFLVLFLFIIPLLYVFLFTLWHNCDPGLTNGTERNPECPSRRPLVLFYLLACGYFRRIFVDPRRLIEWELEAESCVSWRISLCSSQYFGRETRRGSEPFQSWFVALQIRDSPIVSSFKSH